MIGGLFFLLMISSFPWVNYNEVGTGTANLAQKTPPSTSDRKKRDGDSKRDDKLKYHIEKKSNRNYKVTLRRKKNNKC